MTFRGTFRGRPRDVVCRLGSNFQDSKSIFMIGDLFETAEFWCIVGLTAILRLLQRKITFFLIYRLLVLSSEKRLSPESWLAICRPMVSCL